MNNNIFPCFLFEKDAKKAADFYCRVFDAKIVLETEFVVDLDVFGQKIMFLNGPKVEKNSSVSFLINCESEKEFQAYKEQLLEGGDELLMPKDFYPDSDGHQYGLYQHDWIRDQFGVTWQLYLNEKQDLQKIIPLLLFIHQNNGKAMEAMEFYTRIFPNSKIGNTLKYKDGINDIEDEDPENIRLADFEINRYQLNCMDSAINHPYNFNEAYSLVVMTDNQDETDFFWNNLIADGGEESVCGWLKDKYGFSWQITPKRLIRLINDSDKERAQKVMQAMMKMKKIIINDLEEAYNS